MAYGEGVAATVPAPMGWYGSGVAVAAFLALPIALTSALVRLWPEAMPLVSWLGYSLFCWATVSALYRWAQRRRIERDAFAFRRPGIVDVAIAIAGVIGGLLVIWPASQFVAHLLGAHVRGMRFDFHAPLVLPGIVLWAVISAPFCEEVLFRGLAVAYLRARRWPAWAIVLATSAAFAAIHLPYFGLGLALFILPWSAMLCAIRLWRLSLTPGLILHVINNIAAYLIFPLLRG